MTVVQLMTSILWATFVLVLILALVLVLATVVPFSVKVGPFSNDNLPISTGGFSDWSTSREVSICVESELGEDEAEVATSNIVEVIRLFEPDPEWQAFKGDREIRVVQGCDTSIEWRPPVPTVVESPSPYGLQILIIDEPGGSVSSGESYRVFGRELMLDDEGFLVEATRGIYMTQNEISDKSYLAGALRSALGLTTRD